MVDAKYFMAAERNGYNGQIFEALKNRFPEIPEQVISQTLQAEHGNTERCLRILTAESDRFLYGGGVDMLDSPMPVQPSSQNTPVDEPISITIPTTNTSPYLPHRTGHEGCAYEIVMVSEHAKTSINCYFNAGSFSFTLRGLHQWRQQARYWQRNEIVAESLKSSDSLAAVK
ncbi:uncharacterized protein LOC110059837 [Orbicella faveolata]|uniref:uncharacterized protein LOC110059837 n=1 Tax=Orbicella faveolata TaxID=48498 RepID=UPI0009E45753|nr:uncharacterized protein LOC110059837 [Orbicella faveolata]